VANATEINKMITGVNKLFFISSGGDLEIQINAFIKTNGHLEKILLNG
jgi:hypothetical protein